MGELIALPIYAIVSVLQYWPIHYRLLNLAIGQ